MHNARTISGRGRKAARLVWIMALLGLGTAFCTFFVMHGALSEIRAERTRTSSSSDATDAFIAGVSRATMAEQVELRRLLSGYAPSDTDDLAEMRPLLENFKSTAAGRELQAGAAAVETFLTQLRSTRGHCIEWQQRQTALRSALADAQKQAESMLRDMRGAMQSAEGRGRLQLAAKVRRFRGLSGQQADEAAREIVAGVGPTEDTAEALAEVQALSLLCYRLGQEQDIDCLSDLKDNLFWPCLLRLTHLATGIETDNKRAEHSLTGMLDNFKRVVFGPRYRLDEESQTIVPDGTGWFALCREQLEQRRRAGALWAELAQRDLEHHEAQTTLSQLSEAMERRMAAQAEQTLSAARRNILIVGVICGLGSLLFGFLIAATIRRQIRAIERDQQQLHALWGAIEQSPETVVITSPTGAIEYVNPSFTRITGYSREEALGQNPRVLKSGAHAPEFYQTMWQTLAAGSVWHGDLCNRKKNGDLYWESAAISPVRNPQGQVTGFVAIKEDITARRNAQEQLRQAKEAAESASHAKSEFLANMSHEIRTPLNGVVGMIDLLGQTPLDESQRRYAQVAHTSADALLGIINDILDFSKIEAGRMELESIEFDLPNVVEELAESTAVTAAGKGLELGCFIHPDVPDRVVGDPARLRQVLLNLASNAIKFTERGQVVVKVEEVANCELPAASEDAPLPALTTGNSQQATSFLKFSVTDSGVGIPADRLGRLFQSFSQVDASTTRKYGGTGLGLAISKRLVEMMGGTIGVESQSGHGSTFWFTVRVGRGASNPAGASRVLPAFRHLRVLAVDDNLANRQIIQRQLAAWQLSVQTAADGAAALEMLRQAAAEGTPFDVAILDWHMPGMDGPSLARAIRQTPELSGMALVMLSSMDDPAAGDALKGLGFAACLVKPVRQARLLDAIAEARSQKSKNRSPVSADVKLTSDLRPAASARPAHVLLVEDNRVNQLVAQEILTRAGYSCDIASNGKEAVEALPRKHYDLVLMDCQMPEMDGFEATAAIREREKLATGGALPAPHIPIIALTANAIKGDEQRCLDAGMDAYLSKPINAGALRETLLAHLVGRQAAEPPVAGPAEATKPDAPTGAAAQAPSPTPPAIHAGQPIDREELLRLCMGEADFAKELLGVFRDQADGYLRAIETAVAEREPKKLTEAAHSLKGAAASLAAGPVRDVARRLEQMGRAGEMDLADGALQRLRKELSDCLSFVSEMVPSLTGRGSQADLVSKKG